MKNIIPFIFIFSSFINTTILAQSSPSFFNNTTLMLGYAAYEEDRRLFQLPGRQEIWNMDEISNDYDFMLTFNKEWKLFKHLDFATGLGYIRSHHNFFRPFFHPYFTNDPSKEFRYVGIYTKEKIAPQLAINLRVLGKKHHHLYLTTSAFAAFNFSKRVETFIGKATFRKFRLEFDAIEINPGIGYQLNRFNFQLNYRLFHLYKIDRVLFFSVLFSERQPLEDFLAQDYERLNPTKIWFSVEYSLNE
ncbi:MAG: hypothetical protein AAGG68_10180 [Bacteroidota bacterium]